MIEVTVVNVTRGAILAWRAELAASPWRRARGLLGRRALPVGAGLVLRPCAWVHTVGMAFPIDVVHLDAGGRVLRVVPNLRPWRLGPFVWGSRVAVELPAGTVAPTGTRAGDLVELRRSPTRGTA
jgi:uncharacterized protein